MCMRVRLHALWGKVGGDFLRQQVRSPGPVRHHPSQQSQLQDSSQPTAGRALLSVFSTSRRRPQRMSSAGGGAAVTAAGSALDGLVLRLQRRSQAGRGSAFRPAHGQEESGGGWGGSGVCNRIGGRDGDS